MRWEGVPAIPLFLDNTAAFVHELPPDRGYVPEATSMTRAAGWVKMILRCADGAGGGCAENA
jgi:hypothetical protein